MLYAKSDPIESIEKHTNELLIRVLKLKDLYGEKILYNTNIDSEKFWKILELAAKYHDIGKVYTPFQNMILETLKEQTINTEFSNSIKHEELSPLFLPMDKIEELSKTDRKVLIQSIFYHHERNINDIDADLIEKIIEKDIKPRLENLQKELEIELNINPDCRYLNYVGSNIKRIKENDKNYIEYVLVKGLLHRLDHSASAGVPIEVNPENEIGVNIKNKIKVNELQDYCIKNSNENMIITASTGYGKTEAGLLWSSGNKTFFTLPLRISINAIYDRIVDSYKLSNEYVGLLHSSALDYLESKEKENIEQSYLQYIESKNLSKKITVCTVDQIFAYVFKYPGYEKMYATLAYSNLIIDEIQAYSPKLVAIILKGLQMINNIGGKFLIMTATLPTIYTEKLTEKKINFKRAEFLKNTARHRLKLIDEDIFENIDDIVEKSKHKKSLIIVNIVDRAIKLYKELKKKYKNVHILHSRFTAKDKAEREKEIQDFDKNNSDGIWITTQIVEASIDIDFDILFTEMSTLDSLFQRLGRCYRRRELLLNDYNIFVYTKLPQNVNAIYDKKIIEKSIELLKKHNSIDILTEKEKTDMVEKLYSREFLDGTKFLKEFDAAFRVLDNIVDYDISKKEAQAILREIKSVQVIPANIYDENLDLINAYKDSNFKNNKLRREIENITVNITWNQFHKLKNYKSETGIDGIYRLEKIYDKEVGLIIEQDFDEEYDLRSL